MKKLVLLSLILAASAAGLQAQVVINEVLASTTSTDTEFFELYNTTGAAVDLTGWTLDTIESDGGNAGFGTPDNTYTFGAVSIPAGGYFLAINAGAQTAFGVTGDDTLPDNFFENSSSTYVLSDASSNVISTVFITDGGPGDVANIGGTTITPDIIVGPDGTFFPAGFYRLGDGSSAPLILEFSPIPAPSATPGSANPNVPVAIAESAGNLEISFPTVDGLIYQLQSSSTLSGFTDVVGESLPGTGAIESFTQPVPAAGNKDFYVVYPSQTAVIPPQPPLVESLSTVFANIGDTITVSGINLETATAVTINGLSASFTVDLVDLIVTVPSGATTGFLEVTNPDGSDVTANLIVITDPSLFVFSTDFSTGLSGFLPYSFGSPTEDWTLSGYEDTNYVGISGFDLLDGPCDDWLVSPSINLAGLLNAYMLLGHERDFSGPALEVKVSTDYTGGDPTLATWTDLPVALAPNIADSTGPVTDTGITSLSAYDGQTINIAIRYTSIGDGTGVDESARDRIHYFAVGG
ncbi:MAG: lamin tail domain-containing protein, partial [Oceanipulchritudo sp.]